MRAQVAIAFGLIMAATGIGLGLCSGSLHAWFWHLSG
jgi:predicted Co/Zn/Cd cation transporter (cation efflux family)